MAHGLGRHGSRAAPGTVDGKQRGHALLDGKGFDRPPAVWGPRESEFAWCGASRRVGENNKIYIIEEVGATILYTI
jgi:hypothetical protein